MPKALFNISYTAPTSPKNYSAEKKAEYLAERNFFNMTAKYNYFEYILNGEKVEKNKDAESYFTRTGSGLFDLHGQEYTSEQIEKLKTQLKKTKSIIWHGFISFDQVTSMGFTSMEQAEKFIRQTFGGFLDRTHLKKDNIQFFAALHTDHPHHNHIHFAFFEKEPKRRNKHGELEYTQRGKISPVAIDNYMVSANMYLEENEADYYTTRDEAVDKLRNLRGYISTGIRREMNLNAAIDALISKLPKRGRLQYNSQAMSELRPEIDKVVQLMINSDASTKSAHIDVLKQFARIEKSVEQISKDNKMFYVEGRKLSKAEISVIEKNSKTDLVQSVDTKNIDYLPKLKDDYKCRLGNVVLGMCKEIRSGDYLERRQRVQVNAAVAKIASRRQHVWRHQIVKKALLQIRKVDENIKMNFMKTVQQIETEKDYENSKK